MTDTPNDTNTPGVINLVIFSSGKTIDIAYAIESHLEKEKNIEVRVWKKGFFDENAIPVWSFFKNLFCYDYAVIVLAGDEIIKDPKAVDQLNTEDVRIPTANVIFELGAVMARLGPQKTIMVSPHDKNVRMPSYFNDVTPLLYEYDNTLVLQEKYAEATKLACEGIKEKLGTVDEDTFHSDLPAQGLAFGYMTNFVMPVFSAAKSAQAFTIPAQKDEWKPEFGFTISMILPDTIMRWDAVSDFLMKKNGLIKVDLKLKNGRPFGVYVLPRTSEKEPLHIFDIPTTLVTSSEIVERIDRFWKNKNNKTADQAKEDELENAFKANLSKREVINFQRMLKELIVKEKMESVAYVKFINEFDLHVRSLNGK